MKHLFSWWSSLQPGRRWITALAVIALAAVGGEILYLASNNSPNCTTSIPVETDIADSLAFGEAFEPATWEQLYANHDTSVSVRWVDGDGGAIGHLDYLRYNCGLTSAALDEYRFDISLGGYDSWERTAQCEAGGVQLHEFTVVYVGEEYHTRFWLKPANDTRLAAFQLSFPATRQDELDTYSARLFPELSSCL